MDIARRLRELREHGQIWRPWFYPGLVAHSFLWLSRDQERAFAQSPAPRAY
jgi:hypothetical protein